MAGKELVLDLGTEGGGATIFRTRSDAGDWQFHIEGNALELDENEDEVWRSWSTEPVPNIEVALRAVAEDDSWVFFFPIEIHPEYRTIVRELVEAAVAKLPAERRDTGNGQRAVWQRLCK
ncbi:MAG: hypothetical protein WD738_23265 [Pirellulales bacterium]